MVFVTVTGGSVTVAVLLIVRVSTTVSNTVLDTVSNTVLITVLITVLFTVLITVSKTVTAGNVTRSVSTFVTLFIMMSVTAGGGLCYKIGNGVDHSINLCRGKEHSVDNSDESCLYHYLYGSHSGSLRRSTSIGNWNRGSSYCRILCLHTGQ